MDNAPVKLSRHGKSLKEPSRLKEPLIEQDVFEYNSLDEESKKDDDEEFAA